MAPSSAGTVGVRPPGVTSSIAVTSWDPTSESNPIGTLGSAYASTRQSFASSAAPLRLKKPIPARICPAPGACANSCTASWRASQRVIVPPCTGRPIDCERSIMMKTSTGTASASTDTPLHASPASAPAAPPSALVLDSIGSPGQASFDAPLPPVPTPLLEPAVAPTLDPAAALLPPAAALPAVPVADAAPPLVECWSALAGGPDTTVLPGSSLQPFATATNSAANKAIELVR